MLIAAPYHGGFIGGKGCIAAVSGVMIWVGCNMDTERELHQLADRLGYVASIAEVRERVPAETLARLDTSAADLASLARLSAYFRRDLPPDYQGMTEADCGSVKLAVGCPKMLTE